MKPRKLKISYWIITILFALFMLMSGIQELMQTEGGIEVMKLLNYPVYLLTILGIAKVLGVIALLQPRFTILKEWAYAGFAIDFIGAATSAILASTGAAMIIGPMVFLAVLFVSYYLWKRVKNIPVREVDYADHQ